MRKGSLRGGRRRYGAGPLHLIGHLVALGVAAFALSRMAGGSDVGAVIILCVGLLAAHDLLFVPLYTGLDRLLRTVLSRRSPAHASNVPVVNHVRVPALVSGLLLIIYLPLISGRSDPYYVALTGHHLTHYLRNWALITVALFAGSALIFALRLLTARIQGS